MSVLRLKENALGPIQLLDSVGSVVTLTNPANGKRLQYQEYSLQPVDYPEEKISGMLMVGSQGGMVTPKKITFGTIVNVGKMFAVPYATSIGRTGYNLRPRFFLQQLEPGEQIDVNYVSAKLRLRDGLPNIDEMETFGECTFMGVKENHDVGGDDDGFGSVFDEPTQKIVVLSSGLRDSVSVTLSPDAPPVTMAVGTKIKLVNPLGLFGAHRAENQRPETFMFFRADGVTPIGAKTPSAGGSGTGNPPGGKGNQNGDGKADQGSRNNPPSDKK